MSQENMAAEPSGILILHKPVGITSHDAVYKIRKLYGTKRVGHTGTLDPLAEGVLVMLIGRAAKAAEYLVCDSKEYVATIRLGITTDTEDVTGNILTDVRDGQPPSLESVSAAVSTFEGDIMQIPPMYSALKVGGKKLCDLAREGVTVERAARPVTIHSIDAQPTDDPWEYKLTVGCSSGTYIRTLCADIGKALGCGGAMATLLRTSAGGASINGAVTLETLEEMELTDRLSLLMPVEDLFVTLPAVRLSEFYTKLCRSGCEIYQKKIHTAYGVGDRVRICDATGRFFALGEVREYPDGTAIKSIKMFEL